jgi:hypothetical protein
MDEDEEVNEHSESEEDTEFVEDDVIYRDSNFWQRYNSMAENIYKANHTKKGAANRYFSQSFLKDFLKKYIAYLPLSSSFVLASRDQLKRANNGPIEGYFGITKNKLRTLRKELGNVLCCITLYFNVFLRTSMYLGVLGQFKVSRYVDVQEKMVEDLINISKLPSMCSQIHKSHKPRTSSQAKNKSSQVSTIENTIDLTEEMLSTQEEAWRKKSESTVKKSTRFGNAKIAAENL